MATYAEYLRSLGASDEDVKVLDHPIARKAFEAQQAAAAAAEQAKLDYNAKADEWFEKTATEVAETNRQLAVSRANEAKARALILAAKETGMADLAKQAGYEPDPDRAAVPPAPGLDPNRYFTRDEIIQIANKEGDAIAVAQDIASEHAILFPGQRLNFRAIREEAQSRKLSAEAVWMEKYKVADARAAQSKAAADAHDKKIADEAYDKAKRELASQYGNPDVRPLATSVNPFAARPTSGRTRQPWQREDGTAQDAVLDRSGERVARVMTKVLGGDTRAN